MASIRVRTNGKLFFDFRFRGERCREQTMLDDTGTNRRKMEAVLKKIESDIALNSFDYGRYFPNSPMVVKFREMDRAQGGNAPQSDQPCMVPVVRDAHPKLEVPTFEAFVPIWKQDRQVEWRYSYRQAVESILESHLLPAFGTMHLDEIDRAALLAFRSTLAGKRICRTPTTEGRPLTATTINRIVGILRQILDEGAARYDFDNPALKIKRLKIKRVDIQPFSMDEVRRIIDTVRADYRAYLTVRFFTGMRSAEAHGLKWKHIDFERRELLIRETYANGRTEYTKTDGSQREIQMSLPVQQALRTLQLNIVDPDAYVFRTRTGGPIDNTNFNDRVWSPLLRHLDLPRRRPYQMRHTCATLWLAAGENPQWIARQLGHTTTEMLFRTYSRYVPNLTRNDGSAFDRLVTGAVYGGIEQSGLLDRACTSKVAQPARSRNNRKNAEAKEVTHGR